MPNKHKNPHTMPCQAQSHPTTSALEQAARSVPSLPALIHGDADRSTRYQRRLGGLCFDFSRQQITEPVLDLLLQRAQECDLPAQREALFGGSCINGSEQRSALHTALRWPADKPPLPGTAAACRLAQAQLAHMDGVVQAIHQGRWHGVTGEPITDVIHIGVGGSDLGPRLACQALAGHRAAEAKGINIHFAATMDGSQLTPLLGTLNPARTLLVIASKSFTTADTLANARTALEWMRTHLNQPEETIKSAQVVGVSAHADRMSAWGIPDAHQLLLGDWVGGRFSLWSPIGFVVALQLGMPGFRRLLTGAHEMDEHFLHAPLRENIPILAGLLGVWNTQYRAIATHAVLPYDGRLALLPAYLQQLEMESNGKAADAAGRPVPHTTCPIVWGDVGPNGQHAFYQLLHQGSHTVATDLLVATRPQANGEQPPSPAQAEQHRLTLANCLAQSRLLTLGDEAPPATRETGPGYRGNQPTNLLVLDALTPETLGQVLALYEHKVFVQATLWGLNPFDQPGVERGKTLARDFYQALGPEGATPEGLDGCTAALLQALRAR